MGLGMCRRWVKKNVDLCLLSEHVTYFLKSKGFTTKEDKSGKKWIIIGKLHHGSIGRDLRSAIEVRISGNSNDFKVEYLPSGQSRPSILLDSILTLFGGGSLVVRRLKYQEAIQKLEREFWGFIENTIMHLVDSA